MKFRFVPNLFLSLLLALLSGVASAEITICQLQASGQTSIAGQPNPPPRGKILASINKAKLSAGETCDTWRARKEKEIAVASCVLLADGHQTFDGFGDLPPTRGTEVARGTPEQGETCDMWREKKASVLLTGVN